ncbi:hypothetical protein MD484_g7408, partial [Candolleomyces efflorescens]
MFFLLGRENKAQADEERELLDRPVDAGLRERIAQHNLESTVSEAHEMFKDFQRLIKVPPKEFMISVTQAYVELYSMAPPSARAMVQNYYKKMERYHDILGFQLARVRELSGLTSDYREVDAERRQVCDVMGWLDDIEDAEADPDLSVAAMFRRKQFTFQR